MKTDSLVIDCGGYCIKTGLSKDDPRIYLNAITKAKSEKRRPFVSNQLEECRDASSLFYILPFQKGYLINWDIQKTIWDYVYGKEELNFDFANQRVVLTEPYFNFQPIQEGLAEVFFEDMECEAIFKTNPGTLSCHKYMKEHPGEACCLVVDSGYSFTHIVPHVHGKPVKSKTIRIDAGGKLLTNHLKETISYRQLNVMDETYVVNQVKEDTCFVSQDLAKDFELARKRGADNTTALDYILPDFTTLRRGRVKGKNEPPVDGEQLLRMNNERFTIPEVLFRPSDIGISQMGITEAIIHVIESCPPELHPHLYKNIVLTGGNCNLPGFRNRVETDIRSMAPAIMEVGVTLPSNPITYAWQGGASFSKEHSSNKLFVTRKEYDEHGFSIFEDKYSK